MTAVLGLFADAVLRRCAARRRLLVDEATVDRLALALPGYRDDSSLNAQTGDVERDVSSVREALHRELEGESTFARVCRHAQLRDTAAEVLALLVATETEPYRRRLVSHLAGDRGIGLSRVLLAELLVESADAAQAVEQMLGHTGLVDIVPAPSWSQTVFLAAPALVAACLGLDHHEDGFVHVGDVDGAGVGQVSTLFVSGADRGSRREAAARTTRAARLIVVREPADDSAWRAAVRTATLRGTGVLVEIGDELDQNGRSWIERARHLDWVVSCRHDLPLASMPACGWTERRVRTAVSTAERLGELVGVEQASGRRIDVEQLGQIERALPGLEDPASAIRRLASGDLDRLAEHIVPRRRLDDLVLDGEQSERMREILRRFRQRSLVFGEWGFVPAGSVGVTALLAGAPGTGKSMSAEVIAAELGLDLFRIDLSSTVSKYIGETEKNLEAIFRAAEAADVVLLFDEADSLFTKRGEVADAQDRYANMETSYLLQRLERFSGVAVLTSNLMGNIDPAFLRRIHVSISFPVPEAPERRRIWERCFAVDAPIGELDLDFLAERFKIAGGSIRNVALAAAFLAAEAGDPIGMAHIVRAMRWEVAKGGRLVDPSEYGPYAEFVS